MNHTNEYELHCVLIVTRSHQQRNEPIFFVSLLTHARNQFTTLSVIVAKWKLYRSERNAFRLTHYGLHVQFTKRARVVHHVPCQLNPPQIVRVITDDYNQYANALCARTSNRCMTATTGKLLNTWSSDRSQTGCASAALIKLIGLLARSHMQIQP